MMKFSSLVWLSWTTTTSLSCAFLVAPSFVTQRSNTRTTTTQRFLEDWVADMIDTELYRQSHKQDFKTKWMEKNKGAIVQQLNRDDTMMLMMDEPEVDLRQLRKDRKLAQDDPERYCADRCVATGNCDVYEDFFDLSAEQVVTFCEECVLGDGIEPCDIPEGFWKDDHVVGVGSTLKP